MRLLSAIAALCSLAGPALAAERPVIRTESDLPQTRITFPVAPSEAMTRAELLAALPAMRRESERLLADYDIQDKTISQQLRLGLATIAVLEGRRADALRIVGAYRAGENKPQRKLLGGLNTDLAANMLDVPAGQGCARAAGHFTDLIEGADPAVTRDLVVQSSSDFQTASVPFYISTAVAILDPVAQQRGSLNVLQALNLARWRMASTMLPPCREALSAAARGWIDAPANRPVDIWPARQPATGAFAAVQPVVVAVWDRGYDETLFPGQLAHDPAEPLDGKDNDGNGLADDGKGPTYGLDLRPRGGAMAAPTQFLQERLASQMAYDKGELDLRFGFDTREAALFAQFARSGSTAEQADEFLASMENGGRTHGTACASEIADAAPYVRLYNVSALPWGRGEDKREVPYDEATIARWPAAIDRIGPRMRGAGVRVVSMSWGLTADEITQQLLDHGLETDAAKAKARGVAMQGVIAAALNRLMLALPDILFVVAAGNSDQADDIQADAVTRFAVPNLVIVGATGTSGLPTAFTVFGKQVAIYAQGEAVSLRWPGNIVLHESGTSMAAPLVARAAAQMLAVRPGLTAAQVREGLLESATAGEGGTKLLHPAQAVALATRYRGR